MVIIHSLKAMKEIIQILDYSGIAKNAQNLKFYSVYYLSMELYLTAFLQFEQGIIIIILIVVIYLCTKYFGGKQDDQKLLQSSINYCSKKSMNT